MLVMNAEWELKEVPPALAELRDTLTVRGFHITIKREMRAGFPPETLRTENRRELGLGPFRTNLGRTQVGLCPPRAGRRAALADVRAFPSLSYMTPVSHHVIHQTNKAISLFLARNRARNDASNRNEFLYTRAKRRRVSLSSPNSSDDNALYTSSCARADAKPVDRDVMMKFDVARNEEGPLRRTVAKSEMSAITSTVGGTQERRSGVEENAAVSAEKYPALDVRLKDIESHLAVRYGAYGPHANPVLTHD